MTFFLCANGLKWVISFSNLVNIPPQVRGSIFSLFMSYLGSLPANTRKTRVGGFEMPISQAMQLVLKKCKSVCHVSVGVRAVLWDTCGRLLRQNRDLNWACHVPREWCTTTCGVRRRCHCHHQHLAVWGTVSTSAGTGTAGL